MTSKNNITPFPKPPETIYIDTDRIFCDGDAGALGHPRVYLTVDKKTSVVECPYCDRRFVKKPQK